MRKVSRRALWAHAVLILLLAVAPAFAAAAQDASSSAQASPAAPAGAPSAPPASPETTTVFVSRLKAEPVDYQVKLTWVDSPDLTGVCVIYRSSSEITSQNLASATVVGMVPTGTGSFIDSPPDRRGWYYAVLIRDKAGNLYTLVVPFRNKTSAPVSPQTTAPEEQLAAQVSGIRAAPSAKGDSIEVSFSTTSRNRDLLLFWGPRPFGKPEDLLSATKTTPLDPGTTRYVLPVLPGIDYWFAVLDAGLFKLGQAPLARGVNATAYPVQLQVTTSHGLPAPTPSPRRGIPLPSLAIIRGVQSGQEIGGSDEAELPRPMPVSDDTRAAIAALRKDLPGAPSPALKPQVLASDATPTPGSELARLQDIIQGPFQSADWPGAQGRLLDFLSLPRKHDLADRASFYLGQAYFFQGRTRDALMAFLDAQDTFYQESAPWIDACFQALEKTGS
ncbi:MAG TPA: hypothetical protein VMQ10_10275 [Spirochaetia bacterium]|nr:hypothetical protein [Spirochaetia bacterium]